MKHATMTIALACLVTVAMATSFTPAPGSPPEPVEHAYGTHPQQTLDVYLATPGAPTVVMVHGGGFARGDKRRPHGTMLFEHLRGVLLEGGFNVAAINYRLAADLVTQPPQHPYDFKYPAAHDDVIAAMDWISAHHVELGLAWPVGVVGESAGGNLGAHIARTDRLGVLAYLDIGGYQDLLMPGGDVPIWAGNYIGCAPEDCQAQWAEASPARRQAEPIPLLLWHGAGDTIVPHQQSINLASVNVPGLTKLVIVPGAGHTGLPGFATPERDYEVLTFFRLYTQTLRE